MLNFYQSEPWKILNRDIYQKPSFEIELFGNKYFGTIKEKKKLGISFRWYQVMGVSFDSKFEKKEDRIVLEMEKINRDFKQGMGDILFQLGVIDNIDIFPSCQLKDKEFAQNIKKKRESLNQFMINNYSLFPSFRENMPQATIAFDLDKGLDELFSDMSKSARSHIKKGRNRELYFEMATSDKEREEFYKLWSSTAKAKGFYIIGEHTFNELKEYLLSAKVGNLFLAKKDGEIVSGSVCFLIDGNIIYLYGATNRSFGNVGGHHFLKHEIFKWGINNNYSKVDLLGVAPSGYVDHHLNGVTSFKQSLGGQKIEYVGNFDLIFNRKLYELFKLMKS